jgi:hypothetical protein
MKMKLELDIKLSENLTKTIDNFLFYLFMLFILFYFSKITGKIDSDLKLI